MSNLSKSVVVNQFGETSIGVSTPIGSASGPLYISPQGKYFYTGAGAPTQTAPAGSVYIRSDAGLNPNNLIYLNVDGATNWVSGTIGISQETIIGAGALSTTINESVISNSGGSTFAVTLAAPSNQDGQYKLVLMGVATHTITLAMTNIKTAAAYTATGSTTITFSAPGHCVVLMAVGSFWMYLGGTALLS